MLEIGRDELWVNQMSCIISIEVSFHNCLEFIKSFTATILLHLHADHWDLLGLGGESVYIRVLYLLVRASVCGGIAMCRSKQEGVWVKVV